MARNSFLIDKLTRSIEDISTGKSYETIVVPIVAADLKKIIAKNGWRFNWESEFITKDRSVYKLMTTANKAIQGLISLEAIHDHIEMHLIETAPHNYGKNKKYLGAPANLVAYGCKISFDSGFGGFVSFDGKTSLINHYIKTLGAQLLSKNRMFISGYSFKKLVNLYYKDYFNDK
ncbi:MAG: hypothetical protein ABI480_06655 [Chitinophagaceae bacterium]